MDQYVNSHAFFFLFKAIIIIIVLVNYRRRRNVDRFEENNCKLEFYVSVVVILISNYFIFFVDTRILLSTQFNLYCYNVILL